MNERKEVLSDLHFYFVQWVEPRYVCLHACVVSCMCGCSFNTFVECILIGALGLVETFFV